LHDSGKYKIKNKNKNTEIKRKIVGTESVSVLQARCMTAGAPAGQV
jgi:hypothetical protein